MRAARQAIVIAVGVTVMGASILAAAPARANVPGVRSASWPPRLFKQNWAGVEALSATPNFNNVDTAWFVPRVTCVPGETSSSTAWGGLGTGDQDTLFQAGTDSDCVNGVPTYYPWWEAFPLNLEQRFKKHVAPGDYVRAYIIWNGTVVYMDLFDYGKGGTNYKWTVQASDPQTVEPLSSECIVERALFDGVPATLSHFAKTRFGYCTTQVGSDYTYSDPMIPGLTVGSGSVWAVEMQNLNRETLARAVDFGPDGAFSVVWKAAS